MTGDLNVIAELKLKYDAAVENTKRIQAEYDAIINNPEYSLDVRWKLFVETGEDLGLQCLDQWVPPALESSMYEIGYTHMGLDEKEIVEAVDLIATLEDLSTTREWVTAELIATVKSEILEQNYWTWEFDW